MTKHTPTPWLVKHDGNNHNFLTNGYMQRIATLDEHGDAGNISAENATLIVRAVNERQGLIDALEVISKSWNNPAGQRMVLDALAKAKGE